MYALSKLAITLISPLGTCFVLVATALMLFALHWRRAGHVALGVGLAWLLIWSLPQPAYWLCASLEQQTPQRLAASYPTVDAIIVLGGGVTGRRPGWLLRPDLSAAADRVWFGAALYHAQRAPWVILAGGGGPPQAEVEARAMAEFLGDLGVPESAMLLDTRSRNTWQNALQSQQIMRDHRLQRALLVTSALHMPRALATFRRRGIDVIPAATDFTAPPVGAWPQRWLPSADALATSSRAIKEYIGLWVYRLRGLA